MSLHKLALKKEELDSLILADMKAKSDSNKSKSSVKSPTNTVNKKCNCKQKILIVDDNVFNLLPIKLLLKDMKVDFGIIDFLKTGTPRS